MPGYEVGSRCRYHIRYHIVWIVKYRKTLLVSDPTIKKLLEVIRDVGEMYELKVEEIGVDGNHLHLFCHGLPKIAPAKVVEIFKSISARELMKEFPELRIQTFGAGLWGVGYYLSTVGHSSFEGAVKSYVESQGRKPGNFRQLKLIN